MGKCVYQGEGTETILSECFLKQTCNREEEAECKERLEVGDAKFLQNWKDPLVVLDRSKNTTTAIRNLLAGGPAFLVGGGPSTKTQPLELLNNRGIFSLAVNNSAAHPRFRASAFVCSDPPLKFSNSIWFDPHVMKFVPSPKMSGNRERLREKRNGIFERSKKKVTDSPNIWGFKRLSWLWPDERFFLQDGACWGNHDVGVVKTKESKTVCTLLLGLRLLYFLGARTIFLVGVDFLMKPDGVYSFDQNKSVGGCESNNKQFEIVNGWLCRMESNGVFGKFGLKIFNCYENSGLRAFPYVPFDTAIEIATKDVEQKPDLSGWYEKGKCDACGSEHLKWGEEVECLDCGEVVKIFKIID
jgi:hypothetical protein